MNCTDVVFHATDYFDVRSIRNNGIRKCDPEHGEKEDVINKLMGDTCRFYAHVSLEQAMINPQTDRDPSAIAVVCVDPEISYVSEDVDDPDHPLKHKSYKEQYEYYKNKLVTLKEYKEKNLKYDKPEVIIPAPLDKENVIGFIDRRVYGMKDGLEGCKVLPFHLDIEI